MKLAPEKEPTGDDVGAQAGISDRNYLAHTWPKALSRLGSHLRPVMLCDTKSATIRTPCDSTTCLSCPRREASR